MGSDSPSLCVRRVLVVEALPDTDGTGPDLLGVNRTSRRRPCPIRAQYAEHPSQSEPTAANVPSHARETPLVTGPPGHVFQAGGHVRGSGVRSGLRVILGWALCGYGGDGSTSGSVGFGSVILVRRLLVR